MQAKSKHILIISMFWRERSGTSSQSMRLLSATIANEEPQITGEPNQEWQHQERQHLVSYNTTIRSILKGQNLFLVENKW